MKRSFSLIELLVGMTLFALLASLLMGLYIGVSKNTAIQKKQEQRLEELIFLRTILQKSLGQAILEGISEGLYEEGGNLYFTFNNGIDPDPLFSSHVKGILGIQRDDFILEVTPLIGPGKRRYTLRKNVHELSFERSPEEGMPLAIRIQLDKESYTILFDNQPFVVILK